MRQSFFNPAHTLGWGIVFLAVGFVNSAFWQQTREFLQTLLPPQMESLSIWLAIACFGISMASLMSDLLRPDNPLRSGLYFAGAAFFLTSLVFQRNIGNVTLETGLVLLMARSTMIALSHPDPERWQINAAQFPYFFFGAGSCFIAALGLAALWPVTPETEFQSSDGATIAQTSAVALYILVLGIECGWWKGTSRLVAAGEFFISAGLVVSCLWQFNQASLILNGTLGLFGLLNWIWSYRRP